MSCLKVSLFGRFQIQWGDAALEHLEAAKVQELLCFLLIYRNRPYTRETLANLLWNDYSATQSKKYLRQTLWKLQATLHDLDQEANSILTVDPEWVQINDHACLWTDMEEFEQIYDKTKGIEGKDLDEWGALEIKQAVALYRGDLLEGWYQDWCVYERERFQNIYLTLLDKLIGYCEKHGEYDEGLAYGALVLRQDHAREITHRQMMRLYMLSGDRTQALRQYQRCVQALQEELNVEPSRSTRALHEQILGDNLTESSRPFSADTASENDSLDDVLGRLKQARDMLSHLQTQLQSDIRQLEHALEKR